MAKILMIKDQKNLAKLIESTNLKGILALCGEETFLDADLLERLPKSLHYLKNLPYFQRDNIKAISQFIVEKII